MTKIALIVGSVRRDRQLFNLSQENDLVLKGETYKHFINGIRSPATQLGYKRSLRRYLPFLKLKEVDDLLPHPHNPSPRFIKSQIISYI